jgi:predicted HTH transcriptional regulator
MEIGLHPKECEPWATYIATHTPGGAGPKSKQGLTELQEKVYEFVKSKGRVRREEVMTTFKLSEADMDAQMTALYHTELVKEQREGNKVYLISIK